VFFNHREFTRARLRRRDGQLTEGSEPAGCIDFKQISIEYVEGHFFLWWSCG
jgi:hypothetical protein